MITTIDQAIEDVTAFVAETAAEPQFPGISLQQATEELNETLLECSMMFEERFQVDASAPIEGEPAQLIFTTIGGDRQLGILHAKGGLMTLLSAPRKLRVRCVDSLELLYDRCCRESIRRDPNFKYRPLSHEDEGPSA